MRLNKIKKILLFSLIGTVLLATIMPVLAVNTSKDYPDDLVGYWRFDDRIITEFREYAELGKVADDTTYDNTGILKGDASFVSDGVRGEAISFDGSGDYIELPNSADHNFSTFTIIIWAHIDTFSSADTLISKGHRDNDEGWYIWAKSGYLEFWVYTDAWYEAEICASCSFITNQWYMITAVYTGSEIKVYLNGILSDTTATTGKLTNSTQAMSIGKMGNCGSDYYFDGILDEPALYNRVLTEEEIVDIYENGIPDLTNGLLLLDLLPYLIFGLLFATTVGVIVLTRRNRENPRDRPVP